MVDDDKGGRVRAQSLDHAAERQVSQIMLEQGWVSLIGTVISRNAGQASFTLDDGTGQVIVRAPKIPELGSLVRVMGMMLRGESGVVLDSSIIQDLCGFDVDLYRGVKQVEESVFSQEEGSHR